MYGNYPNRIVADAGYGSYENYYNYCFSKGIKGIMKYGGYEKRKQKVTKKNRFKLSRMDCTEDGVPICPVGYAFDLDKIMLTYKGIYPMTTCYYRNNHCDGCPLRNKCTKAKGAFANIKQDFEYIRLHRREESGVAVELSLVCIGYNLRKYHNRKVETKMNSFSTVKIKIDKQNHKNE